MRSVFGLFKYKVVTFHKGCTEESQIYSMDNFDSILRDIKIDMDYYVFVKINCYDNIHGFCDLGRVRVGNDDCDDGSIDRDLLDVLLFTYYEHILSLSEERSDIQVSTIDIYLVEGGGYWYSKLFYYFLRMGCSRSFDLSGYF